MDVRNAEAIQVEQMPVGVLAVGKEDLLTRFDSASSRIDHAEESAIQVFLSQCFDQRLTFFCFSPSLLRSQLQLLQLGLVRIGLLPAVNVKVLIVCQLFDGDWLVLTVLHELLLVLSAAHFLLIRSHSLFL